MLAIPASLCALAGVLAFSSAPALAARGHAFEKTFGEPCVIEPCEPGKLKEPSGVAVNEATGDVYVVDKGNNRVEFFNSTGTKVEGEFNGPSATGTGTLEAGSTTITGVVRASGAFSVGEELSAIAAPGLEPGTEITAVEGEVLKISKPATASETPASLTAHQSFSEPEGIAIDNSCSLHKTPEEEITCKESDPSAGDVYVADVGHAVIDKFTPTGDYICQLTEAAGSSFSKLDGIAVDPKGELWVYQAGAGHVGNSEASVDSFSDAVANVFEASREVPATVIGGFASPGFAVDSKDDLYVGYNVNVTGGLRVAKLDSSGNVLSEAVDSEQSTAVAVELSSDDAYVEHVGTVVRLTPDGEPLEGLGAGHLKAGAGIGVSSSSGTVYVADSAAGNVEVYSLEGPGAPTVESESVSDVSGNSATFQAQVNPHSKGGEAATAYRFEYITDAAYQANVKAAVGLFTGAARVPVPDGVLSPDFELHTVSAHPQDLLAGVVYHFRVLAVNSHGTTEGQRSEGEEVPQTFTTQTAGVFVLPDGRSWEMVSPPDKHGALIESINERGVIQASADGSAMTYVTNAPTEPKPQGYIQQVQVLSTRGASSWGSRDLAIPHNSATGVSVGKGGEYRFFSEDLSLGVVQPFGGFNPSLSPEASEQTAYVSGPCAPVPPPPPVLCPHPLVTGCPPIGEFCPPSVEAHADVPPGIAFGGEGGCPSIVCGPQFVGATPDLSHVVLESKVALTSTPGDKGGLYEWSGGHLALVSMLPGGEPASGLGLGDSFSALRHAISGDGSRIVLSEGSGARHLYLHTVNGGTVQVDAGLSGEAFFQMANENVSEVFFIDGSSENGDLYEYNVEHAELVRLTESAHLFARMTQVLGASEDGSYVYFASAAALAPGATPGKCGANSPKPSETQLCNLYVRHSGTITFIAGLSQEDFPDWGGGLKGVVGSTVRVSPDGRWLAFMSQRSLTGYDNRDAVSGKPDEEVFLYDSARPVSRANPVCVSCNPSGARPAGVEYGHLESGAGGLAGGDRVWQPEEWLAANVPGWTPYQLGKALHQSRYLSDGGRLFFNSSDGLVSQDVNGSEDVYEFEPLGVPAGEHACTVSSVTFSERLGGCVGLISSGSSAEESAFLDASESGGDVFFLTAARLSRADFDTSLDVYDAHECTGVSPCFPAPVTEPPACTTAEACRSAPVPQPSIFGAPSSATFSGVGNVAAPISKPVVKSKTKRKRCKKGYVKKRGKCVKNHKVKKRAGKSASTNHRRAK